MQRVRSYGPAGVLLPLFVLALATLGAAAVSTASADTPTPSASPTPTPSASPTPTPSASPTPTPSASPTPTPSASPTPYPQSTVSVRFHAGPGHEDVTVLQGLAEPITSLTADGVDCTPEHSGQYTEASGYSIEWPRRGPGLPTECTKGPPTALRFVFTSSYLGETLIFTIVLEDTWTGGDLELLHDASFRPSQDASPTPYPQSTITVRFVNGGQPVTIRLASRSTSADGVDCSLIRPAVVTTVDEAGIIWPLQDPDAAPECRKGPPTLLRLEFLVGTPADDEALRLSVEADWEGNDLVLDLDIPDRFVFAPAPTPNGLPPTGGQPGDTKAAPDILPSGGGTPDASRTPNALYMIAGAALLVVSAAVAFSQRPN